MEVFSIITGAMALLRPYLEKAGEKAAETFGEKIAEKTAENSTWQKIKSLFVVDDEKQAIEAIENKTVATSEDIKLIENKLTEAVNSNPQFASEISAAFNLSSTQQFFAEQLLKSIEADKKELEILMKERRNASIDAVGGYENMIARTLRRMEKSEQEFRELVGSK